MGTRTSYAHGTFCWIDLSARDPRAAKDFYGQLFGWTYDDLPTDMGPYSMAKVGDDQVAAISGLPPGDPSPPHWNNYVSVEDVSACAAEAGEHGGTVIVEPFDVMDVGKMAVIQDPTGAVLSLWQPGTSIGATLVNEVGAVTWNELATTDAEKATSFYVDLFGWNAEPMDTGDGPAYTVISVGERANGGIREQEPEEQAMAPPYWVPYLAVESTDESVARVAELGGAVLMQPLDVPVGGGGRIAAIADPQGAALSLWQGEMDD